MLTESDACKVLLLKPVGNFVSLGNAQLCLKNSCNIVWAKGLQFLFFKRKRAHSNISSAHPREPYSLTFFFNLLHVYLLDLTATFPINYIRENIVSVALLANTSHCSQLPAELLVRLPQWYLHSKLHRWDSGAASGHCIPYQQKAGRMMRPSREANQFLNCVWMLPKSA